MTDSFGFNGNGEDEEERYANRIEPIKQDLEAAQVLSLTITVKQNL